MTPIDNPTPLPTAARSELGKASFAQNDKSVGSQFEAVLMTTLVSTMRKSSFGEGLFPGDKSDTLGGLFDMMVAGQIADTGGIGIQDMVNDWLAKASSIKDAATSSVAKPATLALKGV
ncbi:MAG: rod-binding protein [Planctomycetaceae bacterium]